LRTRLTIALVAAGVEMDVLGIAYHDFTRKQRDHVRVRRKRQRNHHRSVAQGIIRKRLTTFGNMNVDVLALKDPTTRG
jgi:hypothetical protein